MTVVDFLTIVLSRVRPDLDRQLPIGERVRAFWATAVAARRFGSADVVRAELLDLARETGLTADLVGGVEDVEHLIRWGFLDRNPF